MLQLGVLLPSTVMNTSLNWLNDYLDPPIGTEEAERILGNQGLQVDGCDAAGSDTVLDVEVTSNRPDCLSHVGIARELAAGSGRELQVPFHELPPDDTDLEGVESLTQVENLSPDRCPTYTIRMIRDIQVGPSPSWLVERLESVGLRSVNNIVDITNFVLLELGQPLHAFDFEKLDGQRIVVRTATEGESFTAIDGSKHQLQQTMLVIADRRRPVALGGVMGGQETEVSSQTTSVLLESAMFDPLSVRRTSRALKLSSDSSYRFERGIDPLGIERASRRAAALMVQLAGGTIIPGRIRVGLDEPVPRSIAMRSSRCRKLLGTDVSDGRIREIFDRLGLSPSINGDEAQIICKIPSHRLDLHREVDLIEEVARLVGLDQIEKQDKVEITVRSSQPDVAARSNLNQVLVGHGYHETVAFSFLNPEFGQPFCNKGDTGVLLDDERRKADPMLRPSLLPSLLQCRKSNQDAGNPAAAFYEVGATWVRRDGDIVERQCLGLLLDASESTMPFRSLRGTIEELVHQLGGDAELNWGPGGPPWLCDGLTVRNGGVELGVIGFLTTELQHQFGLQASVVLAELNYGRLIATYPPTRSVKAIARFPGIERDLSIVVDQQTPWSKVEDAVGDVQPDLLDRIDFLGTYRGKPIPKGRKSISLRMTFRHPTQTLRHDEVDPQVNAVIDQLKQDLDADLRE